MALTGLTALSVLSATTVFTPASAAARQTWCDPRVFVFTASTG